MSSRREVRSVVVSSVVRVAVAISLSIFGIVLVGLLALYVLGLVSGGLGGVEGFIASLGFTGFRFTILPFILAFIVLGLLGSAIVGLLAGVVALLYNHVQPLVGGIVITRHER
jgi:hypothetical protein